MPPRPRRKPGRACESWPPHPKVLAVGEIGLDYHYDFSPRDVQRDGLRTATRVRRRGRQAHRHSYARSVGRYPALLREHWRGGGIMHCFTGDAAEARQALDLGFHLSFGGVLTFPKAEALQRSGALRARKIACWWRPTRPIWRPVPQRGKRNEPAFMVETARRLAEVRGVAAGSASPRRPRERRCCGRAGSWLNWLTSHEPGQARAGLHRARNLRPDPRRSGAGGKGDQPGVRRVGGGRHPDRSVSAGERRQAAAAHRCCCWPPS